jgi:gas vesicle protein
MGLSSFISRAIPTVIGFAQGGPIGAAASFSAADKKRDLDKKNRMALADYNAQIAERQKQMAYFDQRGGGFVNTSLPTTTTGGNGGFGAGFGSFLTDVGRNILSPIGNIFSSPALTPFITPQSVGQPAQPSQGQQKGQESSRSGTQEAFVGGIPNILGQAAKFLRSTGGQVGVGGAIGLGANLLAPSDSGVRITRKMKSQYRSVLNLAGGNYQMAADMIGVSDDFFIAVMLKRFRNDGPVVTKAALRKTKTTVRRLKSMCDMYDSLRPSATRRRSPMKRASTTLISNK